MEKNKTIEQAALDLYTPPFEYFCGQIHDAKGEMFADHGGADTIIARIRGWGRLQYLKHFPPEDLQDEIGNHCAKAMTEYWERENK